MIFPSNPFAATADTGNKTEEVDNSAPAPDTIEEAGKKMSIDNPEFDSDAAEETTEKKEERDEDPAEVCIIDVNSTEVELNHSRIGKLENFEELVRFLNFI